jgi:hypothetical protein
MFAITGFRFIFRPYGYDAYRGLRKIAEIERDDPTWRIHMCRGRINPYNTAGLHRFMADLCIGGDGQMSDTVDRRQVLLAALAGGSIIKAFGDHCTAPWVDYRGGCWTHEEIAQAMLAGHAESVEVVRLTTEGYMALNEKGTE